MSKLTQVTVSQSMFGFAAGQYYAGKKTDGGWKVQNDDGDWIVLPEQAVTVQMKPIAETLAEEAKPEPQPVGKKPSAAEESALEAALKKGDDGFTSQKKKKSEGTVLAAILAGDAEPEPIEPLNPKTLVKMGQEDEMKRKRAKLKGPDSPLLMEGQCWLSDLTEGKLPKSGVDHIITTYPDGFWEEGLEKDIPEFDIYHEWDADVLESLYLAHVEAEKGLFVGYPGTGKTSSNRNYAALIRQPFMRLNGKDGIDASSFIGFLWASPTEGTKFAEGLLPVAMRAGYYMCMDEIFKIPPDIQMNFQTVYEEDGFLLLDEKPGTLNDKLVIPHPEFRLMGTDNAKGTGDDYEKFGATQNQDTSTLDRFGVTCNVPYMSQEKEVATLMRLYPEVEEPSVERLVRVANLIREGYGQNIMSLTLSMRGLKTMCRFILRGLSEDSAYRKVYHSKLSDQSEIETSDQHVRAVDLSKDLPMKSPVQAAPTFSGSAKEYMNKGPDKKSPVPWETPEVPF